MPVTVIEEPISRLEEHGRIPIAFTVERIFAVVTADSGLGGITLSEEPIGVPWVKDYDAIKGEGPSRWLKRFDTTSWGLLTTFDGERRLGGAVLAPASEELRIFNGRMDAAALWDLRVHPDVRFSGIGTSLFRAAEKWVAEHGCRILQVETQNVNVPACRFYVRMGCTLASIDRLAYPALPEETQLVWAKDLKGSPP